MIIEQVTILNGIIADFLPRNSIYLAGVGFLIISVVNF